MVVFNSLLTTRAGLSFHEAPELGEFNEAPSWFQGLSEPWSPPFSLWVPRAPGQFVHSLIHLYCLPWLTVLIGGDSDDEPVWSVPTPQSKKGPSGLCCVLRPLPGRYHHVSPGWHIHVRTLQLHGLQHLHAGYRLYWSRRSSLRLWQVLVD